MLLPRKEFDELKEMVYKTIKENRGIYASEIYAKCAALDGARNTTVQGILAIGIKRSELDNIGGRKIYKYTINNLRK